MENFAKKFEFTEDQASEMKKQQGFGIDDIKDIQDARSKITQEIELSTELKLSQKKSLIQQFNKETSSTDVAKILQFRNTVNAAISSSLDENYEQRVMDQKDVFTLDEKRGLDTAKDFVTKFKALSLDKKREWIKELDNQISERVKLRAQLREEMPELDETQLRKLRRSEMQDLVDNVADANNFLKNNEKYFSKDEQEELKEKMADCTKADQLKLIKEAQRSLHDRKNLHEIFEHLPKEFILTAGAFTDQSLEEKERSIDRVQEEMKKAYKFKYTKACESEYVCQRSADEAYDYFKSAEMLGPYGKIESWKNLDKQLSDEQKLQKEFQQTMKKLAEHLNPAEIAKYEHTFSMSTYSEKKDKFLPDLEETLQLKIKESTTEKKRTEGYDKALQDALSKGYISKNTMALSQKLWKNANPEYKDQTFDLNKPDVFSKKLQPYVDVFNDFHQTVAQITAGKLSSEKAISDKSVEFKQSGLEKRGRIVMELHKIIDDSETPKKEKDATKQPEKTEAKEISEKEKQIIQLTAEAAQAERRKDYESAYKNYQEILELDPNDQMAKRNADHLRSQIDKEKIKNKNDNNESEQKATIQAAIKDVEKQEDIRAQIEEKTILETFADETAGSETVGKSKSAVNRSNRKGEIEREVADKLGKDGFQLQEDGTATEIVTINKDSSMTSEQKAKLKRTAREDIIHSANPKYMQNIQFKDRNGKDVSANEAFQKIEQKDEQLKKTIQQRTLARGLKKNTDSSEDLKDMIDEQMDQNERKVNLAA